MLKRPPPRLDVIFHGLIGKPVDYKIFLGTRKQLHRDGAKACQPGENQTLGSPRDPNERQEGREDRNNPKDEK
jgi:hypothetical protein